MRNDPEKTEKGQEWLSRFEEMLAGTQDWYLDQDAFEYIIHHYLHSNQAAKAFSACEIALRQYPYSNEFMLDKAQALLAQDKAKGALEIVEQVELMQCRDAELYIIKSSALSRLQRHEEAIDLLKTNESCFAEKEQYEFSLGACYQSWGRFKDASRHYRRALQVNPNCEDALYEMAFCLDQQGEIETSVKYYEDFIDHDPFSYLAWHNLGVVYNKINQFDKAVEALEYATALKEDFALAWYNLGNCYMNLEQYEKAKAAYQTSVDQEPSPDALVCLGASCEQLELYPSAITHYKAALRMDPECDDALYGIGVCLLDLEHYFESIHYFRKAIDLNRDEESYWIGLASAEYETGNIVAAMEAYDEAADLNAQNPDVWLDWSFSYYDIGDYERAISLITSGIEEVPEDAELYYRAVVYMLEAGHYGEAVTNLEHALILDYDKHTLLYDFFPDLHKQKTIFKIIERFRDKG